jgi:predicted nucleic acid-binding protein
VSVVYDTAVLVAAERNDRTVWAEHRARLEVGVVPTTTAPVVAQVSRSPRQAQLRRLLRGCEVVPFAENEAHAVGALLARTATADVVDAHLALVADQPAATVLTSDSRDLTRLVRALGGRARVRRV